MRLLIHAYVFDVQSISGNNDCEYGLAPIFITFILDNVFVHVPVHLILVNGDYDTTLVHTVVASVQSI